MVCSYSGFARKGPRVEVAIAGRKASSSKPAAVRGAECEAAARSGRNMAEGICEALRKTVLKPRRHGFVAIWDGKAERSSLEHDRISDEL